MKKCTLFILTVVLLTATSVGANAAVEIVGMAAGQGPVEFDRFVADLGRSDVIFIGDTHDDLRLHGKQLEIVRALYARNPRLAIGVEMFTIDNQRSLDDWTGGKTEEHDFTAVYVKNWSYDWRQYRDLFIFARENHIPMIALNIPKPIMAKVVQQGGKALSEDDRKDLPPGSHWSLPPRQGEYLRRIREQAFGNVPPRFPIANFNDAQALRNNSIAYRVIKYREKAPESKVVVIAGTWHAIKNGAPENLKDYGKATYKVVLPDLREFSWLKPTAEDVDYLITGCE